MSRSIESSHGCGKVFEMETTDQRSEVHVVRLDGVIDDNNVRDLKKDLLATLHATEKAVVVDLRDARLADCTGVGALARSRWQLVESGRLAVFVFPEEPQQVAI